MVPPLPPAVHREITAFDPADPGAATVPKFCETLKLSGRSIYMIR